MRPAYAPDIAAARARLAPEAAALFDRMADRGWACRPRPEEGALAFAALADFLAAVDELAGVAGRGRVVVATALERGEPRLRYPVTVQPSGRRVVLELSGPGAVRLLRDPRVAAGGGTASWPAGALRGALAA